MAKDAAKKRKQALLAQSHDMTLVRVRCILCRRVQLNHRGECVAVDCQSMIAEYA